MENRELFEHRRGLCFRTEIQVADEDGGAWMIEDLDGHEICWIFEYSDGWKRKTPLANHPQGRYESFRAALDAHVAAINASGGLQSDELFWMGGGLPRWNWTVAELAE